MFVGCLGKEKRLNYQRAEGDPGCPRQRAVIVDVLCFGFLFYFSFTICGSMFLVDYRRKSRTQQTLVLSFV
ncbi:hypothetical protein BDV23DRAFT_142797 [Aspergillus alliaceus]|uniref:Uncharacterized protein n=1 Tax=Petromyces alliaceus TaxID=209559 RepID=A0A5N7CQA0_PETAA|nr:hypothetical protein BDV23DRAFT_142797 [Aspergillus alliaceus]